MASAALRETIFLGSILQQNRNLSKPRQHLKWSPKKHFKFLLNGLFILPVDRLPIQVWQTPLQKKSLVSVGVKAIPGLAPHNLRGWDRGCKKEETWLPVVGSKGFSPLRGHLPR